MEIDISITKKQIREETLTSLKKIDCCHFNFRFIHIKQNVVIVAFI